MTGQGAPVSPLAVGDRVRLVVWKPSGRSSRVMPVGSEGTVREVFEGAAAWVFEAFVAWDGTDRVAPVYVGEVEVVT